MMDLELQRIIKEQGYVLRSDNTLHGWTKARMVSLVRELEHNWACAIERIEHQYRLLLGRYAFYWHDLRRNKEDLPVEEGMVIVCLNGAWNNCDYEYAFESAYYIPGEGFYAEKDKDRIVVGWKEIEPFGEVE